MEKFVTVKSAVKKDDKSFQLKTVSNLEPFKIEIISEEFCDKIAETIASTNGAVTTMDDITEGISKPVVMRMDAGLYKDLLQVAEKDEIELVCRYIAIHRITTCAENSGFIGMINHVRDALKKVPLHMRHVLTGDQYYRLYGLIPTAYLASVCNLEKVRGEVGKMDKSTEKAAVEIMNIIKDRCVCEDGSLSEAYGAVDEILERTLFAYRDKNLIDLGNLQKAISDFVADGMEEYFRKLLKKMDSDVKDSFAKFTQLVKEMKESDSKDLDVDGEEPYEYDPVEMPAEEPAPVDTGDMDMADTMNPPAVEPQPVEGGVNTGLEGTPPEQGAEGVSPTDGGAPAGGVVTGLESAMMESFFKKKLKRISKESVAYVRVRGANAPDSDTLCMVISYGFSIVERCEWYMELIQAQDPRYVVPQSYGELESIKNMMNNVLDDLMKNPVVKKRNPIRDMYGV